VLPSYGLPIVELPPEMLVCCLPALRLRSGRCKLVLRSVSPCARHSSKHSLHSQDVWQIQMMLMLVSTLLSGAKIHFTSQARKTVGASTFSDARSLRVRTLHTNAATTFSNFRAPNLSLEHRLNFFLSHPSQHCRTTSSIELNHLSSRHRSARQRAHHGCNS
jgi:hypothetical protein